MDAKVVFVVLLVVINLIQCSHEAENFIVFNIQEKLRRATTTTTEKTQNGQIIRVPDHKCGEGKRKDTTGKCRTRF